MVKKIVSLGIAVIIVLSSMLCLTACKLTEEEIIQRVNKTVQRYYIEGPGKHFGWTEYETEIIYAFDGTPEYALVEFDDAQYLMFIMVKNKPYLIASIQYRSTQYVPFRNPYKEADIEKGNRYFTVTSQKESTDSGIEYFTWHGQYAAMENGVLTNILTGETYSEKEIETMSKDSRKNYKKHSTRLRIFIFPA